MGIISGISRGPVARMKLTWEEVEMRFRPQFDTFQKLQVENQIDIWTFYFNFQKNM
jgi:hypothetical protein